jgi:carbon storage regulator
MLVLTRKPGEKIRIGPEITLTLLEIQGNRVRIGIEAPAHVTVLRGELKDLEPVILPGSEQSPKSAPAPFRLPPSAREVIKRMTYLEP